MLCPLVLSLDMHPFGHVVNFVLIITAGQLGKVFQTLTI